MNEEVICKALFEGVDRWDLKAWLIDYIMSTRWQNLKKKKLKKCDNKKTQNTHNLGKDARFAPEAYEFEKLKSLNSPPLEF